MLFGFFSKKEKAKIFSNPQNVITDKGIVNINTVKKGDKIVGANNFINKVEKVEKSIEKGYFLLINHNLLLHENQSICSNGNVTHAKLLKKNDVLQKRDGSLEKVYSIKKIRGNYYFHKLTIDGDHTYYINDILVHNASRFWVGGTGSWDASTTTHWSASSGGAGGASVPGAVDSVIFDALSGGGVVTVTATQSVSSISVGAFTGTFNTNGQSITCGGFDISGTGTRTVTLGASIINCTAVFQAGTITGLTFNANTSTINLTAGNATFGGGGLTYNNVVISGGGGGTMQGANTFTNLTLTGTAVKTDDIGISANLTITNTITINGNSLINRYLIRSNTRGTSITLTAAVVSMSNVDFRDITGAGAATWSGTSVGNALGNSGITFTTPVTRFARQAGNWSATATWSASSGGAGGASVPLCHDTVNLDSNTGAVTVTADMPRIGANITCTGFVGTLAMNSIANSIFGSFILASGMTFTHNQSLTFQGRSSLILTSAGKSFGAIIQVFMFGGVLTLQDSFNSTGGITHDYGTFDANNFNVTCANFTSNTSNIRTINMGSGTWTLTSTATVWLLFITGLTFNRSTSTIKINDTSASSVTFGGGGAIYNNIWFSRGASAGDNSILNSNTFNDIKDDGTVAHNILFSAGGSTSLNSFTVSGLAGNLITINSTTTGTHTLVKLSGGSIASDYLNIQHSVATPANTWYAGTHSTNNQAVATAGSGWIFTDPTDKFLFMLRRMRRTS